MQGLLGRGRVLVSGGGLGFIQEDEEEGNDHESADEEEGEAAHVVVIDSGGGKEGEELGRLRGGHKAPREERDAEEAKHPLVGADPHRVYIIIGFATVVVFIVSVLLLVPPMSSVEGGAEFIWRPTSRAHFEKDTQLMIRYRDFHSWRLLVAMAAVYLLAQTLCIPGSGTSLNVLAGCLYSDMMPGGEYLIALPLCMFGAAVGATSCYMLSYLTCRSVVLKFFPSRVAWLRQKFGDQRAIDSIILFTSLRMSPVVPAYFLNLAAPLTPIRMWHFLVGSVIGCSPHSLITVKAGATISRLRPGEDILGNNLQHFATLLLLAIMLMFVPLISKRLCPPSGSGPASGSPHPNSNV